MTYEQELTDKRRNAIWRQIEHARHTNGKPDAYKHWQPSKPSFVEASCSMLAAFAWLGASLAVAWVLAQL